MSTLDDKVRATKKARAIRVQDAAARRGDPKYQAQVLGRAQRLLAAGGQALDCAAGVLIVRPGFACDAESYGGSLACFVAPASVMEEADLRDKGFPPTTPEHRIKPYSDAVYGDATLRPDLDAMPVAERQRVVAMFYQDGDGLDVYDASTMAEELKEARPELAVQGVNDDDGVFEQIIEREVEIAGFFKKLKGAMTRMAGKSEQLARKVYKEGKGAAKDAGGFGADLAKTSARGVWDVAEALAKNPALAQAGLAAFGVPPGMMPPGAPPPGVNLPPAMQQQQQMPPMMPPWWMFMPPWAMPGMQVPNLYAPKK